MVQLLVFENDPEVAESCPQGFCVGRISTSLLKQIGRAHV